MISLFLFTLFFSFSNQVENIPISEPKDFHLFHATEGVDTVFTAMVWGTCDEVAKTQFRRDSNFISISYSSSVFPINQTILGNSGWSLYDYHRPLYIKVTCSYKGIFKDTGGTFLPPTVQTISQSSKFFNNKPCESIPDIVKIIPPQYQFIDVGSGSYTLKIFHISACQYFALSLS